MAPATTHIVALTSSPLPAPRSLIPPPRSPHAPAPLPHPASPLPAPTPRSPLSAPPSPLPPPPSRPFPSQLQRSQPQVQYASLLELKCVPAVLLHCAWGPTAAVAGDGTDPGAYLQPALLSAAARKGDLAPAAAFPTGAALTLPPVVAADGVDVADGKEGDGGGDAAPAAKAKPKWFKL